MKSYYILTSIFLLIITLFGCTPDIVVPNLILGTPSINAAGSVQVPATVTVRNQGDGSAGTFKTAMWANSTEAYHPPFVVSFAVPGQTNFWYPSTTASLREGYEETFVGVVTFIPQTHGITVDMWAEGDSCAGDEFMPEHCRVDESDETNNNSPVVSISLP